MKLYATTTSERATKGQGGNEYLEITLTVGKERRIMGIVKLQETEKGSYALDFYPYGQDEGQCLALLQDDNQIKKDIVKQKGKKLKTARPCRCGASELPTLHDKEDCKNPY